MVSKNIKIIAVVIGGIIVAPMVMGGAGAGQRPILGGAGGGGSWFTLPFGTGEPVAPFKTSDSFDSGLGSYPDINIYETADTGGFTAPPTDSKKQTSSQSLPAGVGSSWEDYPLYIPPPPQGVSRNIRLDQPIDIGVGGTTTTRWTPSEKKTWEAAFGVSDKPTIPEPIPTSKKQTQAEILISAPQRWASKIPAPSWSWIGKIIKSPFRGFF